MNEPIMIPHGNEKVMVELTVKEILALSGIRFNECPELAPMAKKKLLHTLDRLQAEDRTTIH